MTAPVWLRRDTTSGLAVSCPQVLSTVAICGLFGQSNSSGRAQQAAVTGNVSQGFDVSRMDLPDPRVLTFSSANRTGNGLWNADTASLTASGSTSVVNFEEQVTMAIEPLYHEDGAHGLGHGTTFAKRLLDGTPQLQRVLLVPRAVGGTPIESTGAASVAWSAGPDPQHVANPGSTLYENAILGMQMAAQACEAMGLQWYYDSIVWHQGEANETNTAAQYQPMLDAVIQGFRQRLNAPNLFFLMGGSIVEQLGLFNLAQIRATHVDTARRVPGTAFFAPPNLGHQVDTGTNVAHFDASGQRVLGHNAFDARAMAQANVLGIVAVAPRRMHRAQVGNAINLWWDRPLCHVTDYNVQYSTDMWNPTGAASWVSVTRPAGPFTPGNIECGQADYPAATISNIAEGTIYYMRVRAVNETGHSDWSPVESIATVPLPGQPTGVTLGSTTFNSQPLSWTAASNAATYSVQQSADGGATWTTIIAGITGLSATATSLLPATAYKFRVFAVNAAGSGTVSSVVSVSTPNFPTAFQALSSGAQANVFGLFSVARQCNSSYAGSLFTVRRDSDNTTTNIGFLANGTLDIATLLTFVGVNNGFVTTLLDQSGAGHNVTQATTANQPQIVAAGALVTKNGLPSMHFTAAAQCLTSATTGLFANGSATCYAVADCVTGGWLMGESASATSLRYAPLGYNSNGSGLNPLIINDAGTQLVNVTTDYFAAGSGSSNATLRCIGGIDNGTSIVARAAGVTLATNAYARSGTGVPTRFTVGGLFGGAGVASPTGYISELFAAKGALSATDYGAYETNAALYFSTGA